MSLYQKNNDVILNPITVEGNFLIEMLANNYQRAQYCMQNIAQLDLGKSYNYHTIPNNNTPEFLFNICCADTDNKIILNKFEEVLYIVSKCLKDSTLYHSLYIPSLSLWGQTKEIEASLDDLLLRYLSDIKNTKIKYYHA